MLKYSYAFTIVLLLFFLSGVSKAFVTNQSADTVIGQINFTDKSTGTSDSKLCLPVDVNYDGSKLFISDHCNNRILIYNSIPTSDGEAAGVVVGQPNMDSNTENNGGVSNKTLRNPKGVFSDGTHLFIADFRNHRVLIFHAIPTTNWASADVVIGQTNFTNVLANQGGACSANTLNGPNDVFVYNGRLFINDMWNNRVLVFNTIPTTNNSDADYIIGQSAIGSNASGTGPAKMKEPFSIFCNNDRLLVSDTGNHRVLIYDPVPLTTGAAAQVVLGQQGFWGNVQNTGGCNSNTLYYPCDAIIEGSRVIVSDIYNNRILVYDSIPNTHDAHANSVIGQLNSTDRNNDAQSNRLDSPHGICYAGSKLIVSDYNNHRVLIFSDITNTPTLTLTPQFTETNTPTLTPSPTVTPSPSITNTLTSTLTPYQSATQTPTSTVTPTVTISSTATPTYTPLINFKGTIISENYIYAAPHPARGNSINLHIHVRKPTELKCVLFNTNNKKVTEFELCCATPGLYQRSVGTKNLANGVYLLLVKAEGFQNGTERVVKRIAIIK